MDWCYGAISGVLYYLDLSDMVRVPISSCCDLQDYLGGRLKG